MNIYYLETLCKVVEKGSFSKAARSLSLTQPTVSLQVKALEEELGLKIIDRSSSPITLTPGGKLVYKYLLKILFNFQQAKNVSKGCLKPEIYLSVGYSPGEYLIPKLISYYRDTHPQTSITVFVNKSKEVINHVLTQRSQIGVTGITENANLNRRLISIPFIDEEFLLTVYPSHPWAKKEFLTMEKLSEGRFIFREQGSATRIFLENALHKAGCPNLPVVMEMGSNEAIKAAIRAGIGVGFISELSIHDEERGRHLVPVKVQDLKIFRPLTIIYLKNILPETVKDFLSFLTGQQKLKNSPLLIKKLGQK